MKYIKYIINLNAGLLNARSVRNKMLTIAELIVEQQFDILAITETWLHGDNNNNNNNNNNSIYLFRVKHYSVTKLFFKMALRTKTKRLNVINVIINNDVTVTVIIVVKPSHNLPLLGLAEDFTSFIHHLPVATVKWLIVGDFNYHLDIRNNQYIESTEFTSAC